MKCPFCKEEIQDGAIKCKHCGSMISDVKNVSAAQASRPPAGPLAQMIKEGHFIFSCSYEQAYAIVERAMKESEVSIKERIPGKGLLKGKIRYGINPFGITVTSTFYSDAGRTQVEVAANLTDSFDTVGVCKKKVAQISDRILSLSMVGASVGEQSVVVTAVASPSLPLSAQQVSPPSYAQRGGPSFKGKATTGFFLSLGGILVVPCAIIGLIMCGKALTGMSTSNNKDGKGMAIAGLIVGLIALLGWLMIFVNL